MSVVAEKGSDRAPDVELSFLKERHDLQRRSQCVWRCWGLSSDDLAIWATCDNPGTPFTGRHPLDPSDLLACELTAALAPVHVAERMRSVLALFRLEVETRYPGAVALTRGEAAYALETGLPGRYGMEGTILKHPGVSR